MSLTDRLKDIEKVEASKDDPKVSDFKNSQEEMKDALSGLVKQFKSKVTSGKIAINDIKDAKDVVSIMQALNDMSTEDSATPQINAATVNFYQTLTKLPDGTKPNAQELGKAVEDVQSDSIAEVLQKQADSLNKSNGSQF